MSDIENKPDRIDKLIAFFKQLKAKELKCEAPDYSSWNQTEEEYQEEQSKWMEEVERKKALRAKDKDGSCKPRK